jgi:hypothetical protein
MRRVTTILTAAIWICIAMPTQAAETRFSSFHLACDGQGHGVAFVAANLGASVNRSIESASVVITRPRGGLNFLQIRVVGEEASERKILLVMGYNQISKAEIL